MSSTNLRQPFSARLADVVTGDWDLSELSATEKANFLASLQQAITATSVCGAIEHTSDWDWRLVVITNKPVLGRTGFGTNETHFADEFKLTDVMGNLLSFDQFPMFNFATMPRILIEEISNDADAKSHNVVIPVNFIARVQFFQA